MGVTSFFVEGGAKIYDVIIYTVCVLYKVQMFCNVIYIMYLTRIRGYKAVVKHFPKERPKNSYQKIVRRRQNTFTNVLKSIKRSYTVTKKQ